MPWPGYERWVRMAKVRWIDECYDLIFPNHIRQEWAFCYNVANDHKAALVRIEDREKIFQVDIPMERVNSFNALKFIYE